MVSSRSRLLALALVAAVVVTVLAGWTSSPARAAVVTSCSNAACPDPTGWATERMKAHAGYPSFGGTINGANCTNYVAWRLIRTLGMTETQVRGLGNANTWDTAAATKGYTVNRTPAVGAVAQWDANHVAYVEQVNADGTIVISESNVWVGTPSNRMWLRHRVVTASAVDHFIHFRAPVTVKSVLAPGDFDGDGSADLLAVMSSGDFRLYRGDGTGGFQPDATRIGTGWSKFHAVVAPGDFSGDGKPDVLAIAKDGRVYLYRGNGVGGWASARSLIATTWTSMRFVFSPGDFSGDGRADVLAVRTDGRLWLYKGNGKGGWSGKPTVVGTTFNGAKLVSSPGDVDGDGRTDVIAVWPDGTVKLYRGTGTAGRIDLAPVVIASGWTDATRIAGRGDVTGDAATDLFVLRGSQLSLHPGDGTGFGAPGIPLSVTW